MEEFTVSITYRVIILGVIVCFGLQELDMIFNHRIHAGFTTYLAISSMLTILIMYCISRLVRKVIISVDSIVSVRLFRKKQISTSDIKGFRFTNNRNGIIIEPIAPPAHKIVIYAYDQLNNYSDLLKWLNENFTNLDKKAN